MLETGYGRSMTVPEAASLLLEEAERKGEDWRNRTAIAMARLCWDSEDILAAPLGELRELDLGGPPQLLVIPSPKLHPMEEEFLKTLMKRGT